MLIQLNFSPENETSYDDFNFAGILTVEHEPKGLLGVD